MLFWWFMWNFWKISRFLSFSRSGTFFWANEAFASTKRRASGLSRGWRLLGVFGEACASVLWLCASASFRSSSKQSRAPLHLTRAPHHPDPRLCDSDGCPKTCFVLGMNGKFIRMLWTVIEHKNNVIEHEKGWEALLIDNFAWILKSQTKRLNLVNNEQSNVNYVRELNIYYIYIWRAGIICIKRGAGHSWINCLWDSAGILWCLWGGSLWFIPYAYEYIILFDLVRDHVNPAVRAVGKSEIEI